MLDRKTYRFCGPDDWSQKPQPPAVESGVDAARATPRPESDREQTAWLKRVLEKRFEIKSKVIGNGVDELREERRNGKHLIML